MREGQFKRLMVKEKMMKSDELKRRPSVFFSFFFLPFFTASAVVAAGT